MLLRFLRSARPPSSRLAALACMLAACASLPIASVAADAKPAKHRAKPPIIKSASTTPSDSYLSREDVQRFIDELASGEGFERRDLERWLAGAKFQPRIVELMHRPIVEPPKWYEYSPSLVSPARVDAGVAFWNANADTLERAERESGVPAEIIVAILGIETYYGRNTGSHRVIDALATLAFDYPRRATFFRGELREFLLLAREQRLSPLVPKGSFAGAIGMPQFMPGSYRRYAIDFDGDGRVDLWTDPADVIGSVANYLLRHDWQRGGPIVQPALIAPEERDAILRRLDGGISERRPLEAWLADGVSGDELPVGPPAPQQDLVGVLMLEEGPDAASYWLAWPNFYVITRYNKSRLYAAAVTTLADSIRRARRLSR